MSLKLPISRRVLVVFIVLVAIIGGMSSLEVVNLTRPPITVTATLQETMYATVRQSVTETGSGQMILNCISMSLGGLNNLNPYNNQGPDYFSITFYPSSPGLGSLTIELTGLTQAAAVTLGYMPDSSMSSQAEYQAYRHFAIPATTFGISYAQNVPVPMAQGSNYLGFNLTPEGQSVVSCLTLVWIPPGVPVVLPYSP